MSRYGISMQGASSLREDGADCVVLVGDVKSLLQDGGSDNRAALFGAYEAIAAHAAVDSAADSEVSVFPFPSGAGGRLVVAPTGALDRDYDDCRRFFDAAEKGVERAIKAGAKNPLLFVFASPVAAARFPLATDAAVLGAHTAMYVPLEAREFDPKLQKASKLFVFGLSSNRVQELFAIAYGQRVARDIGGSDPERTTALKVAEYCQEVFQGTCINMSVQADPSTLEKDYPLLMAVARCSMVVQRHRPCVITLVYQPEGDITETIYLVGKGVTYDTGGLDIKAGGVMAGMHRDKCGAAAVAGVMAALAITKPPGVKFVGRMAMVRNSTGSDGYVADEILLSRAGKRVRVVNTDAEGRLAMADLLCQAKEEALQGAVNPRLLTIATLTGHAVRAVGEGYSIVLENDTAKEAGVAARLQAAGDKLADPFEYSTVRREDWTMITPKYATEDVIQCNTAASSATARGHQFPAAFLMSAAGLDKHMRNSSNPIAYAHLDIAAAALSHPKKPSGAPVAALLAAFARL